MHKFISILFFSFFVCNVLPAQDKSETHSDSAGANYGNNLQKENITLKYKPLNVSADTINNWKNLKAFAYARYLDSLLNEKQKKESQRNIQDVPSGTNWLDNIFSSLFTKVFFWTLAVIFILFILYRLFLTEGFFQKNKNNKPSSTPEVTEEKISSESDFEHLISAAVSSSNYRLAVRYNYLKTLHLLANKNIVELAADKTNYQYVTEIKDQFYKNDFASLTLHYEYVWYGEFNIGENIYHKIATQFLSFNRKIQPGN